MKNAVVKSGFQCKYNINYHFILIPKCRKIVLEYQVKDELRVILIDEYKELELEMLSLEIMLDPPNLFICVNPTHIPSVIVKQFKGVSAIRLHEQSPELVYLGYPQLWKQYSYLWARGYLLWQCRTCVLGCSGTVYS